MYPALNVGDLIIVEPVKIDDINIGDILTFRSPSDTRKTFSHRVNNIDLKKNQIITKGDANNTVDPSYSDFKNCVGRVTSSFPLIGYIYLVMNGKFGLIILGLLLIIYLLFEFEFYLQRKRNNH
jgi:signal peptidase